MLCTLSRSQVVNTFKVPNVNKIDYFCVLNLLRFIEKFWLKMTLAYRLNEIFLYKGFHVGDISSHSNICCNIVIPQYSCISAFVFPPTADQNYWEKITCVLNMYRLIFLVVISYVVCVATVYTPLNIVLYIISKYRDSITMVMWHLTMLIQYKKVIIRWFCYCVHIEMYVHRLRQPSHLLCH